MRVIIVDSDERCASEEAMRVKSMERTRQALEKLRLRRAAGKLKQPEKIGAAAERLLQRSHGYRYYSWELHQGGLRYFENAAGLGSEKGIEGKYVIATSELGLSVLEVVAIYKDLSDVERAHWGRFFRLLWLKPMIRNQLAKHLGFITGSVQVHCNSDVSRRGGAGVKDAARRGAG